MLIGFSREISGQALRDGEHLIPHGFSDPRRFFFNSVHADQPAALLFIIELGQCGFIFRVLGQRVIIIFRLFATAVDPPWMSRRRKLLIRQLRVDFPIDRGDDALPNHL